MLFLRHNSNFWTQPDFWDADDLALEMTDAPNIGTDGSREDCPVCGFEVAGAGVYLPAPELAMGGAVWGGVLCSMRVIIGIPIVSCIIDS